LDDVASNSCPALPYHQEPAAEEDAGVLSAEEEERVAALEAAAAAEDADDDAVAAGKEARDVAIAAAGKRAHAAQVLTSKLQVLLARRKALKVSRALLAAGTGWHAAAHTALGLAAHEAQEAEGLPPPPPEPEPVTEVEKVEEGKEGEDLPPPPPPVALSAMMSLTRAAELAARCGAHGRLANAARAMHNLARSPVIGIAADPSLAANGGARCLHGRTFSWNIKSLVVASVTITRCGLMESCQTAGCDTQYLTMCDC